MKLFPLFSKMWSEALRILSGCTVCCILRLNYQNHAACLIDRVQGVVNRLSGFLKHGGTFLFRDYGRYDLSQLRLKKGTSLLWNGFWKTVGKLHSGCIVKPLCVVLIQSMENVIDSYVFYLMHTHLHTQFLNCGFVILITKVVSFVYNRPVLVWEFLHTKRWNLCLFLYKR